MHNKEPKTEYFPGDVVIFHGLIWVVLNKMMMTDTIPVYHILSTEGSIYSAFDYEMEYVDHLFEMETLMGKLKEVPMKKGA